MPRLGYRQHNARGLEYEMGIDQAHGIITTQLPPVSPGRVCTCVAKYTCANCKAWAREHRKSATASESFYTSEDTLADGQLATLRREYEEARALRDTCEHGTQEHRDAAALAKARYERFRRLSWNTTHRPVSAPPPRSLNIIRDPVLLRQDEESVLHTLNLLITTREAMDPGDIKRAGMQESIMLLRNRLRNIRRSKFYEAE